ncbi:MAG: hypothetical protein JEZ09_01785 [Salinivirgaceae bacterium]|nr:hypothetical protein [Salinivirgaceae bacterium]
MKTKKLFYLALSLFFLFIIACEDDNKTIENTNDENKIKVELTSVSECKEDNLKDAFSSTETCIKYTYNVDAKELSLKHVNAVFNCCPDSILISFSFTGDTLIISESESSALCNCNCQYDLDMKISNLDPKVLYIKVVEPYIGDNIPIEGEIDLINKPTDSLCFPRDNYENQIIVELTSVTECKENNLKDAFSSTEACINYTYNVATKELSLSHVNAAFNCCPDSIMVSLNFSGDTIKVTEAENFGECDCSCLYDISINLSNVEQKSWFITFDEQYIGNNTTLDGTMDLIHSTDSIFCVLREGYPWGM